MRFSLSTNDQRVVFALSWVITAELSSFLHSFLFSQHGTDFFFRKTEDGAPIFKEHFDPGSPACLWKIDGAERKPRDEVKDPRTEVLRSAIVPMMALALIALPPIAVLSQSSTNDAVKQQSSNSSVGACRQILTRSLQGANEIFTGEEQICAELSCIDPWTGNTIQVKLE